MIPTVGTGFRKIMRKKRLGAPPRRDGHAISGVEHDRFAGLQGRVAARTCCGVRAGTPPKQGSPPGNRTLGATDSQNVS